MAPVDGSGSMPACITFVPNLIIYNLGCQGTKKSKWELGFCIDCSVFFQGGVAILQISSLYN